MKPAVMSVMVCLVLLGVFLPQIYAVSLSLQDLPLSIDQDHEQDVSVLFECSNCTSESYIRAVFFPAGSSSYFGFTRSSDGEWVNAPGGSCTKYFTISTGMLNGGTWSGILKIKPDTASAYYTGPGEYQFKVGRYTGSCGAPTWSQEKTIAITGPSPTSSPTHTVTPVPTSTPSPQPTHAPTSTSVPPTATPASASPSKAIAIAFSPTDISREVDQSSVSETPLVLGADTALPASREATRTDSMKPFIISFILMAMGFGLLSGIFAWKTHAQISKSEDI